MVLSHRNKLFGYWVAELLGYKGEAADSYAKSIVYTVVESDGRVQGSDDTIVSQAVDDLMDAGVEMSPSEIQGALSDFEVQSKFDISRATAET